MQNNSQLKTVASLFRKLGYWETLNALVHDETHGHGTIASITNLQGNIAPEILHTSLQQLFLRHPMLRGTLKKDADGYVVALNANFSDIPIRIITTPNNKNPRGKPRGIKRGAIAPFQ
ncbi:MAG: hypothetical protein KAS93_02190, partial [Gammaproteobacteria bacterium]|nr:hypothetical protein [Gammaproteobacteria bacterium]